MIRRTDPVILEHDLLSQLSYVHMESIEESLANSTVYFSELSEMQMKQIIKHSKDEVLIF